MRVTLFFCAIGRIVAIVIIVLIVNKTESCEWNQPYLYPYKGINGLLFFEDVAVGTAKVNECFGVFASEFKSSELLHRYVPSVV